MGKEERPFITYANIDTSVDFSGIKKVVKQHFEFFNSRESEFDPHAHDVADLMIMYSELDCKNAQSTFNAMYDLCYYHLIPSETKKEMISKCAELSKIAVTKPKDIKILADEYEIKIPIGESGMYSVLPMEIERLKNAEVIMKNEEFYHSPIVQRVIHDQKCLFYIGDIGYVHNCGKESTHQEKNDSQCFKLFKEDHSNLINILNNIIAGIEITKIKELDKLVDATKRSIRPKMIIQIFTDFLSFLRKNDYGRIKMCENCNQYYIASRVRKNQKRCAECSVKNRYTKEQWADYMKGYRANPARKKAIAKKKREERIRHLMTNAGKTRKQAEIIIDNEM